MVDFPTDKDSTHGYEKRLDSDCAEHSGNRKAKGPKWKPDRNFAHRDANAGQDDSSQGIQSKRVNLGLAMSRFADRMETDHKKEQPTEKPSGDSTPQSSPTPTNRTGETKPGT